MNKRLIISGIVALITSVLLTTGCKEDTIVKANIVPGDNELGTEQIADTFTVITKTFFQDGLKSSEKITGLPVVQALGTITDQFFGNTNAGIYFQVLPPVNAFSFSAGGYTIDSVVLILPYSGFGWGNRTNPKPQKFKVFRVDQYMDPNGDYYSNQDQPVQSTLLAETTIDLASVLTDTPTVLGENAGFKHMRIRLSDAFKNDIQGQIGGGAFSSDDAFLNYFKGFYVMPDTAANLTAGTDLLPYILFDGGSDYARVAVAFYYREDGSSESKTAFFNYNREKNAHYNRITRNYSGFPAEKIINRYASTKNISDDTVLLQNEPGAVIDVRIPHIQSLPVAAIIKAELVFTQISSGVASDSLQVPNRLTLVGVDANGEEYEINDFLSNDINAAVSYVDGTKRTEKDAKGNDLIRYRINIPREFQKAINDKRNELHLRIKGAKSFPAAYRFVAGGRGLSTNNTQLNIVYSKPK